MKKLMLGLILVLISTMSFAVVGTAGFDSGTDTVSGARPYLQGNFEALGFGTTTSGVTTSGEALKVPKLGTTSILTCSGISFPASQSDDVGINVFDDYEETSYNPIVTAGTGTITSYSATGYYTKVGNIINLSIVITITDKGTATGSLTITPPINPVRSSAGIGLNENNSKILTCFMYQGENKIYVGNYDGTNAIDNHVYHVEITYR